MSNYHKSVLLQKTIDGLRVKKDGKYIDATLGGGGHTKQILELGGVVLGIDADQDSIDHVRELKIKNSKLKIWERLRIIRGNFRDIDKIAHSNSFNNIAGIIFDLGVSSHQIDSSRRGFSFQSEGPLDMRMDQELGVTARDLIKILTKEELCEIFTKYGEESRAWIISDAIVKARNIKPIETTGELARVIENGLKRKGMSAGFSPASQSKKVFQALRIIVNDELNAIGEALPKAVDLLEENGRLCVISFHSLEDRIVKNKFIEFEEKSLGEIITEKPMVPSEKEIEENNRARSAKLRIFERKHYDPSFAKA
ncbi:MAG: 16S rRNA (cytosine(1402)-N(4))-methyltransferase RsmH [Candidatus Levybacteria bacterium]|nr:16S rRNA (cytosine(1402)-N(4))-methyltransferase RsmH [Candidatus Levybacteria bacterium]